MQNKTEIKFNNNSKHENQIEEDFEVKQQIPDDKTKTEIISNELVENTESKSNKRDPEELKHLMELRTEVVKAREKYAALHKEVEKTEEKNISTKKNSNV